MRLDTVRGFDLAALNVYRWHPTADAVEIFKEPHVQLSTPFQACDIDLQGAIFAERDTPDDASCHLDSLLTVPVTATGTWNAVALWFDLGMLDASGVAESAASPVAQNVAVYYLDECAVKSGDTVGLHVRRDDTQFTFTSDPSQWRPRHACIPTWHYDMLNDDARNAAYERAISRSVARKKQTCKEVRGAGRVWKCELHV